METLALTDSERVEIISMFATASRRLDAVAVAPGWEVIGAFPMRVSASVRLSMIGSVSDASLTLSTKLYCVTPGAEGDVTGALVSRTGALVDVESFSGKFDLPAGLYQVHAQIVGNVGDPYFGNARRVAPESP